MHKLLLSILCSACLMSDQTAHFHRVVTHNVGYHSGMRSVGFSHSYYGMHCGQDAKGHVQSAYGFESGCRAEGNRITSIGYRAGNLTSDNDTVLFLGNYSGFRKHGLKNVIVIGSHDRPCKYDQIVIDGDAGIVYLGSPDDRVVLRHEPVGDEDVVNKRYVDEKIKEALNELR